MNYSSLRWEMGCKWNRGLTGLIGPPSKLLSSRTGFPNFLIGSDVRRSMRLTFFSPARGSEYAVAFFFIRCPDAIQ